jgi:palmitoyltransferase
MLSNHDIPLTRTRQLQPLQPLAPGLPSQISRGSSTRTIPPSSSSLTSPSSPTSLPTWTRQQSRVSNTLPSHSQSTHDHRTQSRSAPPGAENGVHTGPYTTPLPPQPTEKAREARSPTFQRPGRGREPSTLPVLREEHRYCQRCQLVKPLRAHHCRACGKVRNRFVRLCEGE